MNTLEKPAYSENSLNQAIAACERGDQAAARLHFTAARQKNIYRCDEALALGYVALNIGEEEAALACFTTAVQLDAAHAPAHSGRALMLQFLNRPAEAKQAADTALRLDANELVALKVHARICINENNFPDAYAFCRWILVLEPTDMDAKTMLVECGAPQPMVRSTAISVTASLNSTTARSDEEIKQLLHTLLAETGFRRLQKLGFHLQANDYYSPLNDCDFLEANADLWNRVEKPADIDWQDDAQFKLAKEAARFLHELSGVPLHPPADCSLYGWKNNFWENADALVQYGLMRLRRPARIVEIGCGWSSLLLKQALARNAQEGHPADVTLIEPYPNDRIFRHLPSEWKKHRLIIQRTPFEIFDQLEAGDVLFYDGSHCSKVASDVNWFFFKVLPRIKPGVIIHIHDISLPQEYPHPWIFERGQTWNEQYVLQAFLMHNNAYKILLANRYLFCTRQKELEELYQGLQPAYGSSFWMEKLAK